MEQCSTILLEAIVLLIRIVILTLCILGLPWRANVNIEIISEVDSDSL